MKRIITGLAAGLIFAMGQLFISPSIQAEQETSIGQLFIDAYTQDKKKEMAAIIEKHQEGVPAEVQSMVGYALSKNVESKDEQDFLLMISREMAILFKEKTGDARLLAAVDANIENVLKNEKKQGGAELEKIRQELIQLGKGEWNVKTLKLDDSGKLKGEIFLKEKESSYNDRYVSFKDAQKAKAIVKKYLPEVKGRMDWFSGGMGMKAVILE